MPPLVALFAWPVVSVILFRKLRVPLAILLTVTLGYLFLPQDVSGNATINLPALPPLDKRSIPSLSALLIMWLMSNQLQPFRRLPGVLPKSFLVNLLLVVLITGGMFTAMTNGDRIFYGPRTLVALSLYDGVSVGFFVIITICLPLLLGIKFFARPKEQRLILIVFCVAGFGYTFLALYEVRMSPQLNNMVFGYFPNSWLQHIRGDGFRPIVFLEHGLKLGVFFSLSVLSSLALFRLDAERKGLFLLMGLWILFALVLSKNLGALGITLILLPVVLFLGTRMQLMIAMIIGALVLTYPLMRGAGLVPVDRIQELAQSISQDRAQSFQTRLENEEILLEKALERPMFGWGGWGRSRIYDSLGRSWTLADGFWVIVIGVGGWVRYISIFGLLSGPLILLFLSGRRYKVDRETSALAILLASNLIDLIPNSGITPLTWLVAGALWGRLELGANVETDSDETAVPEVSAKRQYRRSYDEHHHHTDATVIDEETNTSDTRSTISAYTRQRKRIVRNTKSHKAR